MTNLAAVQRVRTRHLREAKTSGQPLTALTAYDAVTARLFDAAGIDILLIGDSIGNTMLAHHTTLPVTLDELLPPARAVVRVTQRALVVVDLPFGSYEDTAEHAFASAVRLMKESGAHAVKLEGGEKVTSQVRLLTQAGIPVVGHLGFTPQSEHALGGKRVQGRDTQAVARLHTDALALQDAGACAVVLEMVPAPVAAEVTAALQIPTIGIGAGSQCDGQVLVWTDMAGMTDWSPSFARRFGEVGAALTEAATSYRDAVRSGSYPDADHSFSQ